MGMSSISRMIALTAWAGLFSLSACRPHQDEAANGLHFSLLAQDRTNVDFNNRLIESDSVNFYTNEYMYIGSGVGVGDFNRDGLPDIFFCGSQVSSRLYINKGNFRFDDITGRAGLTTGVWCTGVSVIDINNDGWPDIYVCVSHSRDPQRRKNLLFINQGNGKNGEPSFREEAAAYGLADTGYSTQAVFFDYDRDGRLDMYLENHRLYNAHPNDIVPKDTTGQAPAEDRLYRNEGIPPGMDHPVFKDVTASAGIREDGYGLGVVVTDLNKDGWPDIYVANDYIGNDVLWLNNRDGTFRNVIATSMRHQSYNSMGVDAADINNDGWPDLAVLDMLPETNRRKKMMYVGTNAQRYEMERRAGYEPCFTRNMLQLNNGNRPQPAIQPGSQTLVPNLSSARPAPQPQSSPPQPFFSEIGQLAGISETDWSWSVLMADFDNDGWKDMYMTNGLGRDLTNNDFLFYWQSLYQPAYTFSGGRQDSRGLSPEQVTTIRKELEKYGSIRPDNYFFRNNRDLRFTDLTRATGLATPSISQGAAYVDLDNDGDLDIVVNNMNGPAFIWKNELRQGADDSTHNFLTVELQGSHTNPSGIGARLSLYCKEGSSSLATMQYLEQEPVRGYASSVDDRLHFGIGEARSIDSLRVEWPDGKIQVVHNIEADRFLAIREADAGPQPPATTQPLSSSQTDIPLLFTDATNDLGIAFTHQETPFFDFGFQPMLPRKYSQLGPPLAKADVNGDGLMDFFIGGASGQPGKLYIQQPDGSFLPNDLPGASGLPPSVSIRSSQPSAPKFEEDLGAVFFDANGDGHPDLLITGGSTEFGSNSPNNRPRLYLNDGKGHFHLDASAIPNDISVIAQAVAIGDYNGDGQPDLFIGGRVMAGEYPRTPRSYILMNDKGKFRDVTNRVCPALERPGMITAAIWTDVDGSGSPGLLICGEWMPIRFFSNRGGRLIEITGSTGLANDHGLWRSLQAADVDGDGDIDYIVGNMGWNNNYHLSPQRPLWLYAKDMDNNGILDLVPAWYIKDDHGEYKLYPGLDRNQLADEVPAVKKKYLKHSDFAHLEMEQLRSDYGMDGWMALACETTSSVWIENLGHGHYKMHDLPLAAQFAPVNAILAEDFDGDGKTDLLLAGNEYQEAPGRGRYDASYGLFLHGDGHGHFTALGPAESGLVIDGDVRALCSLYTGRPTSGDRSASARSPSGRMRLLLAAVNNERLKCFKLSRHE